MNMIFFFKMMSFKSRLILAVTALFSMSWVTYWLKKTEIISHPLPYKNSTSYVTSNEQRNQKMDSLNKV